MREWMQQYAKSFQQGLVNFSLGVLLSAEEEWLASALHAAPGLKDVAYKLLAASTMKQCPGCHHFHRVPEASA